jgi:hypothetical protein
MGHGPSGHSAPNDSAETAQLHQIRTLESELAHSEHLLQIEKLACLDLSDKHAQLLAVYGGLQKRHVDLEQTVRRQAGQLIALQAKVMGKGNAQS